jgi:hypothetical protein
MRLLDEARLTDYEHSLLLAKTLEYVLAKVVSELISVSVGPSE